MKEKKSISRKDLIRISIVLLVLVLAITLTLVLGLSGKSRKPKDPSVDDPTTDPIESIENAYRSPSSVSVDKAGNIYVSDATANAVTKLDAAGKEIAVRQMNGSVQRVLATGDDVYALVGELAGELVVLDTNLTVKSSIEVGHTPNDIVIKGKVAYVANRFDNSVSVVDLATGKVTATVDVGREPVAMALAGNDLYIANHLSSTASSEDIVASTVTVLDTAKNTVKKTITLTDGTTGVRGLAVSPDGSTVFVTHLVARYTYPTTQLDRGWINSNAFSVIDTKTYDSFAILLDELEVGAANPWDIAVNEDGNMLYVSLSGTQEIMTVNINNLLQYIDTQIEAGRTIIDGKKDIVNYINFLSSLSGTPNRQTRYTLSGNGARDIELVGDKLYVAQYFTSTIDVLDFADKRNVTSSTITVGKQLEDTSERLGEMVWFDARFCYQQWESCASCHPDARTDALNWDNLNDGLGNPKNTKSMLFSHRTPPVMITGARADAETAVRKGMLYIQFNVLEEDMLVAIDDYLRSLLPIDSPYLNRDGTLSEAALRGKKLFASAGCAECHPAPLYTDLSFHKSPYLGTDGTWENREFVTPTLVEAWRSYPWIYNGGVTSMEDIIRKFAPTLKDNEISDLAEFVLSIGIVDEDYGVEQVFGTDKDGNTLTCKLKPGATLETVTVRCQTKTNTAAATVTITLYDADKKAVTSYKQEIGKLSYRQLSKIELSDFKIPSDIKKGSYLEIAITAEDGSALATVYRLNCEVE
ncbi:MAG: c-type cytochrome [Ruminococcaceae bacterium]|nr:c-type cytochrome [Oscillospiraceae bacterium]